MRRGVESVGIVFNNSKTSYELRDSDSCTIFFSLFDEGKISRDGEGYTKIMVYFGGGS